MSSVDIRSPLTPSERARLSSLGVSDPGLLFLLENPDLFILKYFPHRIQGFEDFHLRLIRTLTKEVRGLALYPAAHGKTTIASTLLPMWELCRNPDVRVALILKNDVDAKGIAGAIHAELLANTELIRDFGPFRAHGDDTKPWALERISIQKRKLRAKEPTIAFLGAGAATILGHRTDILVCDDVVHERNSSTPEQRQKHQEWFNLRVETSPEHVHSRLSVVGTLFDPNDLYSNLIDLADPETGEPLWFVQREDAIVDEEEHTTLWPARWPWRRLMGQKAKVGTLDFNKRYRNIAVDKSRMVFKEEYVKGGWAGKQEFPGCLDKDFKIGDYDETWRRAAGFDPAVGLTRSAKFCAHVTLAAGSCIEHERCYWVVDLERDQWTLPQQADRVIDKHREYQLLTSWIEANSYQGGLFQQIQNRMEQRGVAFRVEPHYTTRSNKPDPSIGVAAMSPWFERGWVHIPWADQYSRRKMTLLVDELIQWPAGRTTDTVMALWFAWRALEESSPRFMSTNYLKKPMVWNQGRSRRFYVNPHYERTEA